MDRIPDTPALIDPVRVRIDYLAGRHQSVAFQMRRSAEAFSPAMAEVVESMLAHSLEWDNVDALEQTAMSLHEHEANHWLNAMKRFRWIIATSRILCMCEDNAERFRSLVLSSPVLMRSILLSCKKPRSGEDRKVRYTRGNIAVLIGLYAGISFPSYSRKNIGTVVEAYFAYRRAERLGLTFELADPSLVEAAAVPRPQDPGQTTLFS